MALVLEDGSAPAGANSYATEAMGDDYFDVRANSDWNDSTEDKEAALVRASAALDATYRGRFTGYKTHGRSQTMEWPRTSSFDREYYTIDSDEIPQEIINATCEMAVRELLDPGSMLPDLERGGQIRALSAGSVHIEYGSNALAQTTFQLVDGILSGLLGSPVASFVGTAVRG